MQIINMSASKKYEFLFRLIKEGCTSTEKKVTSSGITESEALSKAFELAKKKFIDTVEIQYTGKFKVIK